MVVARMKKLNPNERSLLVFIPYLLFVLLTLPFRWLWWKITGKDV
jgi:hypothetical protein